MQNLDYFRDIAEWIFKVSLCMGLESAYQIRVIWRGLRRCVMCDVCACVHA